MTDSLRTKNKLTAACDACVFHKLKRFGINTEVNYIHVHSGVSWNLPTVKHDGGILALTGRSIRRPQVRPHICWLLNDLREVCEPLWFLNSLSFFTVLLFI